MRFTLALLLAGACPASELRLVDAIRDQNRKAVMALIAAHADVNAVQPDGSTPLAWAAYEDDSMSMAKRRSRSPVPTATTGSWSG